VAAERKSTSRALARRKVETGERSKGRCLLTLMETITHPHARTLAPLSILPDTRPLYLEVPAPIESLQGNAEEDEEEAAVTAEEDEEAAAAANDDDERSSSKDVSCLNQVSVCWATWASDRPPSSSAKNGWD
jgi:hypothetical protein